MKEERRRTLEKALEVGIKYTIIGVERFLDLKDGGRGLLIRTTAGLRRTASKVVIAQLTDKETIFPVEATLVIEKSKATGMSYEVLKEKPRRVERPAA